MNPLHRRVHRLEAEDRRPPEYVVTIPEGAWGDGAAEAAAVAAHRERTGYRGAVIFSPEPCDSAEDWLRRHAPHGGAAE